MFQQGDQVRLTAFHRGEDHNGCVVELNVCRRLVVAGHVTGSPDVRCRFPERPNRTVIVPAAKLARCRAAGGDQGGEPAAAVPACERVPPRRRAA